MGRKEKPTPLFEDWSPDMAYILVFGGLMGVSWQIHRED
jgi:hypothetical protein